MTLYQNVTDPYICEHCDHWHLGVMRLDGSISYITCANFDEAQHISREIMFNITLLNSNRLN